MTLSYAYDYLNRLTATDYPSDPDIGCTYDHGTYGKGHLTALSDASGGMSFTYDQRGRLIGRAARW